MKVNVWIQAVRRGYCNLIRNQAFMSVEIGFISSINDYQGQRLVQNSKECKLKNMYSANFLAQVI
jgi:hypothetical protein